MSNFDTQLLREGPVDSTTAFHAADEIERLRAQLVKKDTALNDCSDLIKQLDYIHQHPEYKSVWTVNQLHCGPYNGPKYDQFMERSRKAIETALSDD